MSSKHEELSSKNWYMSSERGKIQGAKLEIQHEEWRQHGENCRHSALSNNK
jgi:hypothetical protein